MKRMEVDCWHHQEPSLAPQSSREFEGGGGGGGLGQKPVFINIFFFQTTSILIRSMAGTPIYMVYRYMTRDFKGKTLIM